MKNSILIQSIYDLTEKRSQLLKYLRKNQKLAFDLTQTLKNVF